MSKLKTIAEGWKNVIIKDENVEALAAKRMAVCNACPSKGVSLYLEICKECGCPLVAKTRATENTCPLKKWKE